MCAFIWLSQIFSADFRFICFAMLTFYTLNTFETVYTLHSEKSALLRPKLNQKMPTLMIFVKEAFI